MITQIDCILALLVSTLLKFILGQSCIYTTGLYKFDMLDLYAGIIPTDGQLCTLICSFFNILSISIISWFLTISILSFYCFRGWEFCICSLVLFTNARFSIMFTVKSDALLQAILQCCNAIFQY